MGETIVTDDGVKADSDAEKGLEEKETKTGAEPDGVTVPLKTDAEPTIKADVEAAKLAWNLREERRARKDAEEKIAALEAQIATPIEGKPEVPNYDDFADTASFNKAMSDYHEKLTDWKINQREQQIKIQTAQSKLRDNMRKLDDAYNEKAAKAIGKYPDYIDVV